MMPKTSTPTLGAAGFSGMPSPTGAAACYIHLELQLNVGDAQEPAVERSPGSPRLFFLHTAFYFLQYQWPHPGTAARQGLLHWKCRQGLIF